MDDWRSCRQGLCFSSLQNPSKDITRHLPPRHTIDAALWSVRVKWHSGRGPGALPRLQRLSHPLTWTCAHRAAGSCHFQRPRQLHPPRHDLCPHWLQVHSRARDDVCSCQCHPHSLIARSCQPLLTNMDEIHGGSPWGAGAFPLSLFTFSSRCCLQPSAMMIRQNAGHSHSFRHIFQRHGRSHAQSD